MIWLFLVLVAIIYFGSRNSSKPHTFRNAVGWAITIIILAAIACALGFTGFFVF